MKVGMSEYLKDSKVALKRLIDILLKDFAHVSVLGCDTCGKRYAVQKTGVSISDSGWTERGFVVRVHNGVNYSEYSFNMLDPERLSGLAEKITENMMRAQALPQVLSLSHYPVPEEIPASAVFCGETRILPGRVDAKEIIGRLTAFKDKALALSEHLVDYRAVFEEVHVSKQFLSNKRDLEQSYVWSQGYLISIVRRGNDNKYFYKSFSGLKGAELLDEMESCCMEVVEDSIKLLGAETVKPGEYDVICSPSVAGLVAHEAFGHGVELDMFVKKRAKAEEYLGKRIASDAVTMHDGAKSGSQVASYLFDDEGTFGTDTVIIDKGIFKAGISDLLSAMRLGTAPTGNGRRESFERKAYARMTNTFFAAGNDKLEDMIASIRFGYLLDSYMSGMEDPKNWGIQCMLNRGHEIVDGRLTGRIISPIIMTGYVPDMLSAVTMVSGEIELSGSGSCGKGHKEFAKVSAGGPYIKTRARLG